MDIVSRLKEYINYSNIPVTQFADNCKIPRPTLSQLLNGRNKKVSDELIGKIHAAYPELSMLWLMFGEGEMLGSRNFEFSGAQNSTQKQDLGSKTTKNETIVPEIDFQKNFSDTKSDNSMSLFSDPRPAATPSAGPTTEDADTDSAITSSSPTTITFGTSENKRIVNIIVYYDDNSFQSFVPKGK